MAAQMRANCPVRHLAARPSRLLGAVSVHIPHAVACRALGASRFWSCKWRGGAFTASYAAAPAAGCRGRDVVRAACGKYGSPRITAYLRDAG
jgi:hypothetical protein